MTSKRSISTLFISFLLSLNIFAGSGTLAELGKTVSEIYVKGSINDDNLFLVLGLEKGSELFKEAISEAINLEDLTDLKNMAKRGMRKNLRRVYNRDHDNDIIDHVGQAAEFTAEAAGEIFKTPWRSLKKIPKKFKIDIQNANEAAANASNAVFGTVGYSAIATYAVVKGAYYLVIEAPVGFAATLAATVLAVPATIAYEAVAVTSRFVFTIGATTVGLGYFAAKAIVYGAFSVGAISYSAISTTAAAALTTTAYIGMGAVKLTANVVSLPTKIGKKILKKYKSRINYKKLNDFANNFKDHLREDDLDMLGLSINEEDIQINAKTYKATVKLKSDETDKVAAEFRFGIDFDTDKEKQNLFIKSFIIKSHFKKLKEEFSKVQIERLMKELILTAFRSYQGSYLGAL